MVTLKPILLLLYFATLTHRSVVVGLGVQQGHVAGDIAHGLQRRGHAGRHLVRLPLRQVRPEAMLRLRTLPAGTHFRLWIPLWLRLAMFYVFSLQGDV